MISDDALIPILASAEEGDMFMAGTLLKGLSDEKIAWQVIESVHMHNKTRITLHAYWHDIFVISKVVSIINGTQLHWGATKV
jgi:hypothetical protein